MNLRESYSGSATQIGQGLPVLALLSQQLYRFQRLHRIQWKLDRSKRYEGGRSSPQRTTSVVVQETPGDNEVKLRNGHRATRSGGHTPSRHRACAGVIDEPAWIDI
ncbi:hypothetical protein TGRH88_058360 [Toxoplasma gondii]|uniref:Uncharacterized protein n=1 Tax=Toxoplasma gondii TaxID=5811 RepID=A0A7J6JTL9_TOXGO|nr:hypothetical protein TGRH88_058360 [Toxoplasma gondii]